MEPAITLDPYDRDHLWTPGTIRKLLGQLETRAKRSLGQHFLADRNILRRTLDIAQLQGESCVLEIGPGLGLLTRALSQVAGRVVCVEIDPRMAEATRAATADLPNVTIHERDILTVSVESLFGDFSREMCHVVANLPYGISKPLLRRLVEHRQAFATMTVMLQKEVARRVVAQPATSDYGPLSVAFHLYGEAYIGAKVPATCFFPRPQVDSCIVHARLNVDPAVPVENETFFFCIVRAAFGGRRKTLVNALTANLSRQLGERDLRRPGMDGVGKSCLTREKLRETIAGAGIDPHRRGETLTVEEFGRLTESMLSRWVL